jgi:Carboxypeptidase regulatory-like domain
VIWSLGLLAVGALALPVAFAEVRLVGRVTDGNSAPVSAARIVLKSTDTSQETFSDPTGSFHFELQTPGDYSITVERASYFELKDRGIHLNDGSNEVALILDPVREVFESVHVSASPPGLDMDRTNPEQILTGKEILDAPYPGAQNLNNAMRLLPSAIQDSSGGIHINGGTQAQVLYTLDGFNISDPLTGRLETRLSVESVHTMEFSSGALPAEFGKGAVGLLAVKTETGDDKLRYSGTNFVPGITFHKGLVLQDWAPRFNISGPIRKGRAWLADSASVQYVKHVIDGLPRGKDSTSSWSSSNLLRSQVNLTPANILYTGFLTNYSYSPRSGLSVLDPPPTTIDRRSRQWFFDIKDQIYFQHGALLELGFASNRTFGREIPQGHDLYILAPDGRQGNYFVDATRKAGRDQFLTNLFLPSFQWNGNHQLKLGADVDRVSYWQNDRRTGYENFREDGTPVSRVVFGGNGRFGRSNLEASSYLQDTWKPKPKLLVEAGVRQDWDAILGATSLTPRVGIAWSPPQMENTKLSAGYAFVRDATSLSLFTRALDQYSLTTHFIAGGVAAPPSLSVFEPPNGKLLPSIYQNAIAGLEQRLPGRVFARVDYVRRRGRRGLTYVNTLAANQRPSTQLAAALGITALDGLFELENQRRDVFDSVTFTFRQEFHGQYEWMTSYTRSRALSNAVVDLSADNPTLIGNNAGRMPWDSPNRFLSWGYLPLPGKNWALPFLLEYHDGFPFSIQDDAGRLQGAVNSYRFPAFFELNLHIERRFLFRGHRWEGRLGFNNITDHKNPTAVNNNTDSLHFLTYYGGTGRTLNFRIRWLGKVERTR